MLEWHYCEQHSGGGPKPLVVLMAWMFAPYNVLRNQYAKVSTRAHTHTHTHTHTYAPVFFIRFWCVAFKT